MGMTTRIEYAISNGVFSKRKSKLRVMGNQQVEGIHYDAMRQLSATAYAIAAQHGAKMYE